MAIALVKAGTPSAHVTPTFGQATTAGNLLICRLTGVQSGGNCTATISGTGWTLAVHGVAGLNAPTTYIWYRMNCGASETAPTVTCTGGTTWSAELSEWSGAATTSALDKTGTGTANFTAACSGNDTNASDLAVAVMCIYGSGTPVFTDSWSPSGGSVVDVQSLAGGTSQNFHFTGYLLSGNGGSAADTDTATTSGSTSSRSWAIASFLPASGATPQNITGLVTTTSAVTGSLTAPALLTGLASTVSAVTGLLTIAYRRGWGSYAWGEAEWAANGPEAYPTLLSGVAACTSV